VNELETGLLHRVQELEKQIRWAEEELEGYYDYWIKNETRLIQEERKQENDER